MIVVDTSVAVKWVIAESGYEQARCIGQTDRVLCSPHLAIAELTNVLLKRERAGDISPEQAQMGLPLVIETIGNFIDERSFLSQTLAMARRFRHSAYDCFFLACAVGRGVLVTADLKFAEKVDDLQYRKHIVTLDRLTPDILDMAVAACSISRELKGRIEFMGQGATGKIRRALQMAGSDLTKQLAELSDDRNELWLRQFATEVDSLRADLALDLVSLIYLGSDGRSHHDWQDAKTEAKTLIAFGLGNMPDPAGFRASNLGRGLRIAFESYLPTASLEPVS